MSESSYPCFRIPSTDTARPTRAARGAFDPEKRAILSTSDRRSMYISLKSMCFHASSHQSSTALSDIALISLPFVLADLVSTPLRQLHKASHPPG